MSLGTGDLASETGDDSLSVITFDSDSETKAKSNRFHKPPPTSPKSPYHSKPRKVASWRSLRTAASMPLGNRMSATPQKLWLGSSKQGSLTQPPKSALTLERACPHAPISSPDYLAEALRMKRSNLRRSASNGHVPGTPVYREKEDMYDEIIGLKKLLHVQKSDVDLMRTKLRRLEEENTRKDRQIEQLLDPSRGSDFVWTQAEKRPETGWIINGLKQRILKLEQQCKDKDSTISKLQTDMKTTSLEEMRIAMEMYYEEIHRLQTLLASSETTGRKTPAEKKASLRRHKRLSSPLLSLSRSVRELTEENQSLKEDLDRVLSSSPTISHTKGYTEWSKPRLLRRIAELEKKISSMESAKPEASHVVKSDALALCASSALVSRQPRAECPEDSARLRGAVRSLKGERKTLLAQLQERDVEVEQLLQTKADLERELQGVREGEEERRAREEALREEIQALTKKFQDLEAINKEKEDDPMEVTPETRENAEPDASEEGSSQPPGACSEERRHVAARILQARWKVYRRQKKQAALDEVRKVYLTNFKKVRGGAGGVKWDKYEDWYQQLRPSAEQTRFPGAGLCGFAPRGWRLSLWGREEVLAATVLQAAFRGHLARTKLLLNTACGSESPSMPGHPNQNSLPPCMPSPAVPAEGDPELEAAVTVIQSVFRAHLARVRHSLASSCRPVLAHCPFLEALGADLLQHRARPEDSPPFLPGLRTLSAPAREARAPGPHGASDLCFSAALADSDPHRCPVHRLPVQESQPISQGQEVDSGPAGRGRGQRVYRTLAEDTRGPCAAGRVRTGLGCSAAAVHLLCGASEPRCGGHCSLSCSQRTSAAAPVKSTPASATRAASASPAVRAASAGCRRVRRVPRDSLQLKELRTSPGTSGTPRVTCRPPAGAPGRRHLLAQDEHRSCAEIRDGQETKNAASRPRCKGQEDSEGGSGDTVEGPTPWARVPAAPQPCPAKSPPSGQQPGASPHAEEVYSDDSDEIVMAPSLPAKRNVPRPLP
ncbi:IQ domain-containing protein E [Rhynchonycteris naso]